MTFRKLTEPQEKSRNAAHRSAIMHSGNEWLEPTGSQLEMDHSRRWIAAGDGSRPEMDRGRRGIAAGEGSRPERDCGRRWMTRWITNRDRSRPDMDPDRIWMDDRRWMIGDGSQEMDHWRRMTINLLPFMKILQLCEIIPLSRSLTLISNYEVTLERRYADIRCTGGIAPPSTIPTTIQSTFPRYRIMQLHARVPMPNTIPNQIPSHTATMPIPHISKPYEISLWQSNDLKSGG